MFKVSCLFIFTMAFLTPNTSAAWRVKTIQSEAWTQSNLENKSLLKQGDTLPFGQSISSSNAPIVIHSHNSVIKLGKHSQIKLNSEGEIILIKGHILLLSSTSLSFKVNNLSLTLSSGEYQFTQSPQYNLIHLNNGTAKLTTSHSNTDKKNNIANTDLIYPLFIWSHITSGAEASPPSEHLTLSNEHSQPIYQQIYQNL